MNTTRSAARSLSPKPPARWCTGNTAKAGCFEVRASLRSLIKAEFMLVRAAKLISLCGGGRILFSQWHVNLTRTAWFSSTMWRTQDSRHFSLASRSWRETPARPGASLPKPRSKLASSLSGSSERYAYSTREARILDCYIETTTFAPLSCTAFGEECCCSYQDVTGHWECAHPWPPSWPG